METQVRFPIGGPRQPVYEFLRRHGWIESQWSDKQWTRADGLRLHLYGTGSMACIRDRDGKLIVDDALDAAVAKTKV